LLTVVDPGGSLFEDQMAHFLVVKTIAALDTSKAAWATIKRDLSFD
jgi:hypothetical protein